MGDIYSYDNLKNKIITTIETDLKKISTDIGSDIFLHNCLKDSIDYKYLFSGFNEHPGIFAYLKRKYKDPYGIKIIYKTDISVDILFFVDRNKTFIEEKNICRII